jgi:hypothetical protein
MVNRAALGLVGSSFRMEIERGKIHEFADATWSSHPAYCLADNPVVPPTFLTTQIFWQAWGDDQANPWSAVELDQIRGLHAQQEFVFFGPPPRAGSTLTGQSRIDEISEKQGRRGGAMTFVTMVTEFRDESGRVVAETRLTGVETARPPEGTPA